MVRALAGNRDDCHRDCVRQVAQMSNTDYGVRTCRQFDCINPLHWITFSAHLDEANLVGGSRTSRGINRRRTGRARLDLGADSPMCGTTSRSCGTNAEARQIEVGMSFTTTSASPVILSLPAWTPGAYEISNFARNVSGLPPDAGRQAALRLGQARLRHVACASSRAGAKSPWRSTSVRADTLDNAMAWTRPDFALFNGTNVFLYPEGQPAGFSVDGGDQDGAGVPHRDGDDVGGSARARTSRATITISSTCRSSSASSIYDSATIAGQAGCAMRRIPSAVVTGAARATAWQQLKRIVIPPSSASSAKLPWDTYTRDADRRLDVRRAIRVSSTATRTSTSWRRSSSGSDFQPSLYAHEIFHSWNVKRLRPAGCGPYQYDRAAADALAVGERGNHRLLRRSRRSARRCRRRGRASTRSRRRRSTRYIGAGAGSRSRMRRSTRGSIRVDGTGYIYYPKGSLAGFMLDVMIRDASDNKKSLDDVMRGLYQSAYKKGNGFTSADWWGAVTSAAGGKSFTAFNAKYIDGREAFPWDSILPLAGLRARQQQVPRLGVLTTVDANGVLVANVTDGSSAALAGVQVRRLPDQRRRHCRDGSGVWLEAAREVRRGAAWISVADQGSARSRYDHTGRKAAVRSGRSGGGGQPVGHPEGGEDPERDSQRPYGISLTARIQSRRRPRCRWYASSRGSASSPC